MALETLLWILAATILDGLIALVGAATLLLKKDVLGKLLMVLVAFSTGALLGGAFLHLMPEAIEAMEASAAFSYLLAGFVIFFLIEKFLHWHHCHEGHCDVHAFTYLILFGDGIHNFIDGLVIAASFLVGIPFGIVTTLLIIGHELPQELGDFGVMVYGGFSRKKALCFNLLSQMTAVAGGAAGFMLSGAAGFAELLLPFAAGGFVYIAASDLIPELHKEKRMARSMLYFGFFLVGIGFMLGIKLAFGG
ncbi:MAG: ZIP family metal transporter [Candidatus Aenigmarchaeota archaeon]|nr:ZIP family metal transporter [Candidatus Aenigmarchaeota archaeon]